MNRRGFMGAILAAGVSPWVARAGILMPVKQIVRVGAGKMWAVSESGGFMYAMNLSEELRRSLQPMTRFRAFCDKPSKFDWNVVGNIQANGGKLIE